MSQNPQTEIVERSDATGTAGEPRRPVLTGRASIPMSRIEPWRSTPSSVPQADGA
ncbi:MAG: hypothetical protein JNL26_00410 [Gemmatimonadetes bacterium]|nr:hypothetical protein [Gemmatimonadota bacterium]